MNPPTTKLIEMAAKAKYEADDSEFLDKSYAPGWKHCSEEYIAEAKFCYEFFVMQGAKS